MLEACPPGSSFCRVRGGSFCTTHEPDDPAVVRALKAGAQVYEVGTGRPLRDVDCSGCGGDPEALPPAGRCAHHRPKHDGREEVGPHV